MIIEAEDTARDFMENNPFVADGLARPPASLPGIIGQGEGTKSALIGSSVSKAPHGGFFCYLKRKILG
jgi:hypothetical protein